MTLWEKYLEYHPEFLERLNSIEDNAKKKFMKKLTRENDKENFLSIVTEFQFYELFSNRGFEIQMEKEYMLDYGKSKYKPDFTIKKHEHKIIVEVLKLNMTNKDRKRSDFENRLWEEVENIQISCGVKMDFLDEYFDVSLYDEKEIASDFSSWLSQNCVLNAEVILYENFKFTITSITQKHQHVCIIGNSNSIDIDIRRLNSLNSEFVKKFQKYSSLIDNLNMPYIICLKIDFHAGINENELFWAMYGDLLFYQHLNKYESEMNGFYYTHINAVKHVSGVLLMLNNKTYYYNNFSLYNKLDDKIKTEFTKEQCVSSIFNKLVYLRAVSRTE
ncbi:MAG: hypothetical protein V4685_17540 [Bacteroidota bacterium]